MKIAILTPTRGRPEGMKRLVETSKKMASDPDSVSHFFYVDSDDPCYEQYIVDSNSTCIFGEPQSVSKSWNCCAKSAIKDGADVFIMGNDDQEYCTPAWDHILKEHLARYEDEIYCAWFDDGINGEKHCAFPIVSRKWYMTVGYFAPECFNFGYNDTWIFDIAKRIHRTHYIPEVIAEHKHFTVGKSEMDDTYARNRTQERGNLYEKDKIIFESTVRNRIEDSEKLLAAIKKHRVREYVLSQN